MDMKLSLTVCMSEYFAIAHTHHALERWWSLGKNKMKNRC